MFGYKISITKDSPSDSTTTLPRSIINTIFKMSDYENKQQAQQIIDALYIDGAMTPDTYRYYTYRNNHTKKVKRIVDWGY